MKNLYASIIILLIMISTANIGYCQDKKVQVYFGNGVFNDEKDADDGLSAIQELLGKADIQGDLKDKIVTDVSHNPSDGILDLYEAAKQTHDLAWSAFWRILAGLELMPDFMQDGLKIISARFDEETVKSYPSIQEYIKIYNDDLCRGDKVVVVAHSQGNLYANIAYKSINENVIDGFGIVSVANPSWYVAGDNSNQFYTTIDEDLVIGFIPGALRSNVNNFPGLNSDDLSGHMFIDSYLVPGLEAESRILDHIITKIYNLQWPEGICPQDFLIASSFIYNGSSPNQKGSPEYYIVWDIANNKMADNIPLDDGGIATFPIKKEHIFNWIFDNTVSGTSVLSTSFPDTGSFSWAPSNAFDLQAQDAVEKPGDESPCTYDPNGSTPLPYRCWLYTTSGSDNWGGSNMIDEIGSTDLSASRQWHQKFYHAGGQPAGAVITGTYSTPSVSSSSNPIRSPRQIDITSLTNQGGTRRRVVSGEYTRYWEEFYYIPPDWPHSEINHDGKKLEYTAELTVKNPFDNDVINLSLERWERLNGMWGASCEGLGERREDVRHDFFQVDGIHNNSFMVVFYAEYLTTSRIDTPCVSWINGGFWKCEDGVVDTEADWLEDCFYQRQFTPLQEWPFKVKAFSKKVSEGQDIMNMNPFELPENAELSLALKSVRAMAMSNPNPEVNPDTIEMNTRIFLNFISTP